MRHGFCLSRGAVSRTWLSTWLELPVSPRIFK
jgi:hypothetical protein